MNFTDGHILQATAGDIPRIVALLNMSYRGERSRKGWTTEADLIAGDIRSNEEDVTNVMNEDGSFFLLYKDDDGSVSGCLNVKKQDKRVYIGMFAVEPEFQGKGVGGALLNAAETYATWSGCRSMYMYVISIRDALIAWYKRKGYSDTGERVPFYENFTGKHLRPLEFAILEKVL